MARLAMVALVATVVACAPAIPSAPPSPLPSPPLPSAAPSAPPPSPLPSPSVPASGPGSTIAAAGPQLLLLAGTAEAASLSLLRLSGEVVPLPLPDPSVAAFAPIAGGALVALLRDGRAFVAPSGTTGLLAGVGWRALALSATGEMPPGTIIWSATASPDGTRIAAIARPHGVELPGALIVIDPGRGQRTILPLDEQTEGAAPAWLGAGRVAILQRDHLDRLFLALVEVATGRTTDRLPIRILGLATTPDGRTWAIWTGRAVVVGPSASVIALRRAPDAGPALAPGDAVQGGMALSEDGRYLAVTVGEGDSPRPSRIVVFERAGGAWHAAVRLTPPIIEAGGWLTWLP